MNMAAQVSDISDIPTDAAIGVWDRILAFELPSSAEFVQSLTGLSALPAVLLLASGLVYLLQGWKVFKILIVINAAILGAFLGQHLGTLLQGENMPLFCGLAGALLLAALAWPLMKFALSLMGGLAGSFLGYGMWHYAANVLGKPHLNEYAWAGALIGLITLGLLSFLIFKLVVMIFTSLQGSIMTVSGILALLLKYPPLHEELRAALTHNMHLLPLLMVVPAVIGFAFQNAAVAQKAKKKRKASGD